MYCKIKIERYYYSRAPNTLCFHFIESFFMCRSVAFVVCYSLPYGKPGSLLAHLNFGRLEGCRFSQECYSATLPITGFELITLRTQKPLLIGFKCVNKM